LEYKASVNEEAENTDSLRLAFDHDTPEAIDSQNEESGEVDEEITFSMLSSAIDLERDDEEVVQVNPERINTIDLSFDHDTSEIEDSLIEEPAINNEADEDIAFSILNSSANGKTEAGEESSNNASDINNEIADENITFSILNSAVEEESAGEGNQDTPSDSLPGDQETDHSDVILLQTILKAAKGFRSINQRLHKIAEARLTPSANNGDSKEKDTREI